MRPVINKRKRYGADFKVKVALDALKGDLTLAQLKTKHGLYQAMISTWRNQAIEGMASVFSGKTEATDSSQQVDIEKLHAKIGQLVVEQDFLVKASGR